MRPSRAQCSNWRICVPVDAFDHTIGWVGGSWLKGRMKSFHQDLCPCTHTALQFLQQLELPHHWNFFHPLLGLTFVRLLTSTRTMRTAVGRGWGLFSFWPRTETSIITELFCSVFFSNHNNWTKVQGHCLD